MSNKHGRTHDHDSWNIDLDGFANSISGFFEAIAPRVDDLARDLIVATVKWADDVPAVGNILRDLRMRATGRVPRPGDVIGILDLPWESHRHYAVMADPDKAIYLDEALGRVVEQPLETFSGGSPLFVVDFEERSWTNLESLMRLAEDPPEHEEFFTADEVVARARGALGAEPGNGMPWRTCDEFAFWCRTGVAEGDQKTTEGKMRSPFSGD